MGGSRVFVALPFNEGTKRPECSFGEVRTHAIGARILTITDCLKGNVKKPSENQ
jgi:hypothetical protein